MDILIFLLILTVVTVSLFDFTNGFHDASDMVATAIASRAMTPTVAILLVTLCTFISPFLISLAVADTIGTFINLNNTEHIVAQSIIISGLFSAVTYNLVTWKLGLPSSSTNSLVGGLVGSALFGVGNEYINWGIDSIQSGSLEGVMKIVMGLFFSPIAGFIAGFILMKIFMVLFSRFTLQSRKLFVFSQYLSISWLGFSHGANDAQKGMAIITMALLSSGVITSFSVPFWVILLCAASISVGTLFGGWSIIKTLGYGIIKVKTIHSFTDQMGSALINTIATYMGAPTSTTQVVTATLIGVGGAEKPKHIRWKTVFSIIGGWFLNIPISMLLGAVYCFLLLTFIKG